MNFAGREKIYAYILGIAILFLFLRLPGLDLPYHQDEWKNVSASSSVEGAGKFFAHPPLQQVIFVAGYKVFGPDNMRAIPLIFGLGSLALLYAIVARRCGRPVAMWSSIIFAVCSYSVLGSLVPDVDGAILPFFFLAAVYSYDRWLESGEPLKGKWLSLLAASLLLGFLFKLSFILAVGAIFLDYAWSKRRNLTGKRIIGLFAAGIGFGMIYALLIFIIQFLYPAFDISLMFGHAGQYSEGVSRNWIQIAVQASKAAFYISPLLLIPLVFLNRKILAETRIFGVYLVLGIIFYFGLFDFSRAALDKYLMFAVVPLSVLVGGVFSEYVNHRNLSTRKSLAIISGIIVSLGLLALNFINHDVLPLYPKTLWFTKVFQADWNFLNPFHGGSGPLGFYVSFLFIGTSFIVAAVIALAAVFKKALRPAALVVIFVIGLSYNFVFAEELLFGRINGSSADALNAAVSYISSNQKITRVMTYNDIGAGPLSALGKYERRIYATPDAESGYKELFEKHELVGGHFLVVNIPLINPDSFYGQYFAQCDSLFSTTSGRITANVYECHSK